MTHKTNHTNETVKNVFTDIYYKKKWGGSEDYYSGYGSHDIDIIMPYIDLLINIIINNDINTICDVGCGDFNIMNIVDGKPLGFFGKKDDQFVNDRIRNLREKRQN